MCRVELAIRLVLQFMAIDHESFSTSLYERAFFMVTMDDGQASKKTSHGQVDCGDDEAISALRKSSRVHARRGDDWASILFAGFRESCTINDAIEVNESVTYSSSFFCGASRAAHPALNFGLRNGTTDVLTKKVRSVDARVEKGPSSASETDAPAPGSRVLPYPSNADLP
jgi:hypothetical protein